MKKSYLLLTVLFLAVFALPAFSQKNSSELKAGSFGVTFSIRDTMSAYILDGSSGITMGPETLKTYGLGVAYHVLDELALEPSFFAMKTDQSSKDKTAGTKEVSKNFIIGPSFGVYYYSGIKNGLYLYTGPCLGYAYHKYEQDSQESEYKILQLSAVLGFKYMFNDTLGLFFSYGLGFTYSKGTSKNYDSSGALTSDYEYTKKSGRVSNIDLGIACYF